jgi:hypothetical protein
MNSVRFAAVVLAGVSMMGLAACGAEKESTGAAPVATTATTATSATAAPTTEASTAPATKGLSDKQICESSEKASTAMKKELFAKIGAANGEMPPPAEVTAILTPLADALTLAASGGDSKVATAAKKLGDEFATAAAAKDPATAIDTPAGNKASADLRAACTAAGVKTTF